MQRFIAVALIVATALAACGDDDDAVTETFTFFAPNDDAFTTLTAEQTAELLTDPSQIVETLRNHTLDTTVTAEDLTSLEQVSTRAGETLDVTVDGDTVMVGDVTAVTNDIEVGDGVIHVVDGFLIL